MGLSSHPNVFNTCLRILTDRGYALRLSGEIKIEGQHPTECFWIAEKDDFYFCADNPIELLGLVAIRDHLQPTEDVPYWWRTAGTDLHSELMDQEFGDCRRDDGSGNTV